MAQTELSEKLSWYENFFKTPIKKYDDKVDSTFFIQLEEARETNDKVREAFLRKHYGMIQLTCVPDYEKAIDHFIGALMIEDSLNLKQDQIITYLAMARVFEEVGDHYKSAELLGHAESISESFKDVHVLVYILNKLGKINAARGNVEAAFENYNLVLQQTNKLNSPLAEAEALSNKAHLFTMKGQFTSALDHHKRALAIRRSSKDRLNEAQSLNDIGELYRLMKNDEKALANQVVALKIRDELKDLKGLAQSYNNVGILYYNQKNYPRSIANLELALEAAKASRSVDQRAKSHEYLSYCFKNSGDFENALYHKEAYIDLIEFMRNEKVETELLESQNRYVLEKKELEISKLEEAQRQREQKLVIQKKLQNFLFALIGFGVIIILLIFYMYLIKRRANVSLEAAHARVNQQNQELQNLNATKDKFFSIISHDLKGPLNSFTAFSKMLIDYTDSMTKDEIQMLAREIDKNLKNVYALLENLLEWSRSQTGNIEFKPAPFDLHAVILQNKELLKTQAGNKKIELVYTNTEPVIIQAHAHSINTVIRNLISNAIKFTPPAGTIRIDMMRDATKVTVSIADTGVGMSQEVIQKLFRIDTKYSTNGTANEKGTGLGLILCKDFIEKNGGKIGVTSEPGQGSIFYFTLPLSLVVTPAEAYEKEAVHA